MSRAYKCDRCSKYCDDVTRFQIGRWQITNPQKQDKYELCDECVDSLEEFLDGAGISRETDCRTEQLEKSVERINSDLTPIQIKWYHEDFGMSPSGTWKLFGDDVTRRTVLKEQVDMGARNY